MNSFTINLVPLAEVYWIISFLPDLQKKTTFSRT